MFHKSNIDTFYPSVEDYAKDETKRLATYKPNVSKWVSAYREIVGTTKSLVKGGAKLALAGREQQQDLFIGDSLKETQKPIAKALKDIASINTTTAMITGDHPYVDFVAGAIPYVGLSILGGAGGWLLKSEESLAESFAEKTAYNAMANSFHPGTMRTMELAKEVGVNSALAGQASLELDNKGNVKVDPTTLTTGLLLSGGIPALGLGAKAWYKSIYRARAPKEIKSAKEIKDQEITPDVKMEETKSAPAETVGPTESRAPEAYKSTDELPETGTTKSDVKDYVDVKLPETDNVKANLELNPTGWLDSTHLHNTANAVKDLSEQGVIIDGLKYDLDSADLSVQVNESLDQMKLLKDRRGSQKVALTKTVESATDEQRAKWQSVINKAKKVSYRSEGAIKFDTDEKFLQFEAGNFDPEDIQALKAAPEKDLVAKSLLGLQNLSRSDNFDADLATMKALKRNILLYKNGILDLLKNWAKDDDKKINDFTNKMYAKYADYFTNPLSSGYLKMTANKKLFNDLVSCLLGELA